MKNFKKHDFKLYLELTRVKKSKKEFLEFKKS